MTPRTNYILVDFENVQPGAISPQINVPLKVLIFVGETQTKIPVELAVSLQSLGDGAEYIQISGTGKNALDFHIAYWIGRLAEKEPNSYFHIVSKDKGFDPLVKHLRQSMVLAQRVSQLSEIRILSDSLTDRVLHIANSLRTSSKSRPRKRKTLKNAISTMFMKSLNDEEIDGLIDELAKKKLIVFSGENLSYNLEAKPKTALKSSN